MLLIIEIIVNRKFKKLLVLCTSLVSYKNYVHYDHSLCTIRGWSFLTLGTRSEEVFKKWQKNSKPILLSKIFSHPHIFRENIFRPS